MSGAYYRKFPYTQNTIGPDQRSYTVSKKDEIILSIRTLAGDAGLYRRERAKALSEIKAEVDRQLEWMMAQPHGGLEPARIAQEEGGSK